jgi:hypothetical protein
MPQADCRGLMALTGAFRPVLPKLECRIFIIGPSWARPGRSYFTRGTVLLQPLPELAPTVARTCPKLATDLALIQAAFSGITADQIVAKQK